MIEIIAGEKGKGKTKHLLDKVNRTVKTAKGSIVYLDSFLTISSLKEDEMTYAIKKLDIISEKFSVKFVLSVSKDEKDLPECARARIILSL